MGSPKSLLPIFGLAGLAASMAMPEPEQPSTQTAKPAEAPAPPPTASAPSGSKPKRTQPSFLSGASLLPPPGTATQGKSLLGT